MYRFYLRSLYIGHYNVGHLHVIALVLRGLGFVKRDFGFINNKVILIIVTKRIGIPSIYAIKKYILHTILV